MTHITFKRKPIERSFENLVDDFITEIPLLFKNEKINNVPVNITESNKSYSLEVVAPGFQKSDFKINLDRHTLTISAEKQDETGKSDEHRKIRNEYSFRKFSRSFTIDEKIDFEKIDAEYVNGVLILTLPKKESVNDAHEIVVK